MCGTRCPGLDAGRDAGPGQPHSDTWPVPTCEALSQQSRRRLETQQSSFQNSLGLSRPAMLLLNPSTSATDTTKAQMPSPYEVLGAPPSARGSPNPSHEALGAPPQPEAPQILLMRCWAPLPAQPEAPQMPSPYDVLGVHPRLSPRLPKCLLLMRRWVSTAPRRPRLPTSQARPDSGSVGMGHTAPPAPGDLVGRGQRPRCPRLTPHAASSRPWTGPKGGAPVAGTSRNHAGGSAHDRKMTRVPATRGLLLTKQYTTVLSAGASCGIY